MFGVMTDFLGRVQLRECNQQRTSNFVSVSSRCWVASSVGRSRMLGARTLADSAMLLISRVSRTIHLCDESEASEAENSQPQCPVAEPRAVVAAGASSIFSSS